MEVKRNDAEVGAFSISETSTSASYKESPRRRGFQGERVHCVQIGLGTFATFVQNLAGTRGEWDRMVGWLMEMTSAPRGCRNEFKGVAVEPVLEHVRRLKKLVQPMLPQVELVHAAIGENDMETVEMHVLTQAAHDELVRSVSPRNQRDVRDHLGYFLNMTSIGSQHPIWDHVWSKAWRLFGIDVQLEVQRTTIWNYGRLAGSLNFVGCELLMIDAEGHDAQILRSMIEHCLKEEDAGRNAWPDVIVFEMAGHCDCKEGVEVEAPVVKRLAECGYEQFGEDFMNVFLVKVSELDKSERLQTWLKASGCQTCQAWELSAWPIRYESGQQYCRTCGKPPWKW